MGLPRRPPNQTAETVSWRALQARLPPEWVCYAFTPDYGFDGQFRPFEGSAPTGHAIDFQLKSIRKPRVVGDNIVLPLKTSTLNLYARTSNSVWIIAYVPGQDAFYYVDAHEFLRELVATRGMAWQSQGTVQVRVPLAQRLEGADAFRSALASFVPSTGIGLTRAETQTSQRVWRAAIQAALATTSVPTRQPFAVQVTGLPAARIRDILLQRGPVAFVRQGSTWSLASPSTPGAVAIMESGAAEAVRLFAAAGWADRLDPEALAMVIAFGINQHSLPVNSIGPLLDTHPNLYVWCVQHLLFAAPKECAELADVTLETRPWSPSPGRPPTALQHELGFRNSRAAKALQGQVQRVGRKTMELVVLGNRAHMVLLEVVEPGAGEEFRIGFIEGRGPGAGKNVGYRSGPKPRRVRATKILGSFPKEQPFGLIYSNVTLGALPTLSWGDAEFTVAGGQEGLTRVNPDGSVYQVLVDGAVLAQVHESWALEAIPEKIPGRKRAEIRGTQLQPGLRGAAFFMLGEPVRVGPDVLEALQKRYERVETPG